MVSDSVVEKEKKYMHQTADPGAINDSKDAMGSKEQKHLTTQVEHNNLFVHRKLRSQRNSTKTGAWVNLELSNPLQTQEIIRLGGNNRSQNFTASLDGQVIGYLWGQINDGEVYHLNDREMMLEYIYTKEQRKGHGRHMVVAIFDQLQVDTVYGETNEVNKSFWMSLGARIEQYPTDPVRDMYEFSLKESDCFKAMSDKGLFRLNLG